MADSSDDAQVDVEGYILRLLGECREEIRLSDSKASILFAAVATATALLVNLMLDSKGSLRTSGSFAVAIGVLSIASLVLVMVQLGLAVMPRVGHPEAGRARWFEEQALYTTPAALLVAVTNDAHGSQERHAQQLLALARTARRKYQHLRRAMLTIAASMGLLVVTSVAVATS